MGDSYEAANHESADLQIAGFHVTAERGQIHGGEFAHGLTHESGHEYLHLFPCLGDGSVVSFGQGDHDLIELGWSVRGTGPVWFNS